MEKEKNTVLNFEEALAEKEKQISSEKKREELRKKRKANKKLRRFLVYLVVIVLLVCMVGFSVYKVVVVKLEERALVQEQQSLESQKKELKEELKMVNDPEYIEQQARKQLNLIMPGETLYVLPDKNKDKDGQK